MELYFPSNPVFKSPQGQYLTTQLFYETAMVKENVLYTLKDEDTLVTISGEERFLPSFRRLYVEERDPSEFKVAQKYFAGWPHWKRISSTTWFSEYLALYRDELSALLASESLSRLYEVAKSDTKINQYLLDKGFLSKPSNSSKVGRPSREAIKQKALELVDDKKSIQDDFSRLQSFMN